MGKITDYLVVCGKMNRLKARKVEILRTQKKDVKYEKKMLKKLILMSIAFIFSAVVYDRQWSRRLEDRYEYGKVDGDPHGISHLQYPSNPRSIHF